MKQNISVGIDIGKKNTRVVVCEETAEGTKMLGFGISNTVGVRHGYIVSRDDVLVSLKKALRGAQTQSGIKIKQASIAIGGVGIDSSYSVGSSVVSRADAIIGKVDIEKPSVMESLV